MNQVLGKDSAVYERDQTAPHTGCEPPKHPAGRGVAVTVDEPRTNDECTDVGRCGFNLELRATVQGAAPFKCTDRGNDGYPLNLAGPRRHQQLPGTLDVNALNLRPLDRTEVVRAMNQCTDGAGTKGVRRDILAELKRHSVAGAGGVRESCHSPARSLEMARQH